MRSSSGDAIIVSSYTPEVVFLVPTVRGLEQVRLFEAALDHVRQQPDLVNRALEVTLGPQGEAFVTAYDLP